MNLTFTNTNEKNLESAHYYKLMEDSGFACRTVTILIACLAYHYFKTDATLFKKGI